MNLTEKQKKEKIAEINSKWYKTAAKHHDEESTIRNFIYPFLEALGWNLALDLKREVNDIDCVLYFENRPYIGIEAKSLSYGVLEESKSGVNFNKERLLKKCREIGARYAVISRYIETIVFKVEDGSKIASFKHPNEYIDKLEDLKILQKPFC
jgi:hypothetical protein